MGLFSFFDILFSGPKVKSTIQIQQTATGKGLPLVFGRRKVQGRPVFKAVSNHNAPYRSSIDKADDYFISNSTHNTDEIRDDNDWLHTVTAFCVGPVHRFADYRVDGVSHRADRFRSRAYVRLAAYKGSVSQTAFKSLNAVNKGWNDQCRGAGIAYIAARYYHRPKKPQFQAEPKLEAIIEGGIVYDPRLEDQEKDTVNSFPRPDKTMKYSANRALVLLTYLISKEGANIPIRFFDIGSFQKAADYCDRLQKLPPLPKATSGRPYYNSRLDQSIFYNENQALDFLRPFQKENFQPQHAVGVILDPKNSVIDNIKILLEGGLFSLVFVGGQYRLIFEHENLEPVLTLTEETIISLPVFEYGGLHKKYQQVTVEFYNEDLDFELDTVSWPRTSNDLNPALDHDGRIASHSVVKSESITDRFRAEAWAELLVKRSLQDRIINNLKCAGEAVLLEPGDCVILDLPHYNLNNVTMIVDSISVDIDLIATLDLVEFDRSIYEESDRDPVPVVDMDPPFTRSSISPPIDGLTATAIHDFNQDGTAVSGFLLTWKKPNSGLPILRYFVTWWPSGDPDNIQSMEVASEKIMTRIMGLKDDASYNIAITYANSSGYQPDDYSIVQFLTVAGTGLDEQGDISNNGFSRHTKNPFNIPGWIIPENAFRISNDHGEFGSLVHRGRYGVILSPMDPEYEENLSISGSNISGQLLVAKTAIPVSAGSAIAVRANSLASSQVSPGCRLWAGLQAYDEGGHLVDHLFIPAAKNPISGNRLQLETSAPAYAVYTIPNGIFQVRAAFLIEGLRAGHVVISYIHLNHTDIPAENRDMTQQPGGPAQVGADVTGQNISLDTSHVDGEPASVLRKNIALNIGRVAELAALDDGDISIFEGVARPKNPERHDRWFQSDDRGDIRDKSKWFRYHNNVWEPDTASLRFMNVLTAVDARETADGKVTVFTSRAADVPANPAKGDIWVVENTNEIRVFNGQSFVVRANHVSNTSQIIDGAGLGTKAKWSGVTGTGKPQDGATVGAPTGTKVGKSFAETVEEGAAAGQGLISNDPKKKLHPTSIPPNIIKPNMTEFSGRRVIFQGIRLYLAGESRLSIRVDLSPGASAIYYDHANNPVITPINEFGPFFPSPDIKTGKLQYIFYHMGESFLRRTDFIGNTNTPLRVIVALFQPGSRVITSIGVGVTIDGGEIAPNTVLHQPKFGGGDNQVRGIARQIQTGQARDGERITFDQPYENIPKIIFGSGGLSYSSHSSMGASVSQQRMFEAINKNKIGFTARLRLKGTSTGLKTVKETSRKIVSGKPTHRVNMTENKAFDDTYRFKFNIIIQNLVTEEQNVVSQNDISLLLRDTNFHLYEPGSITVGFYTRSSGDFFRKVDQRVYHGRNIESITQYNGLIFDVFKEGMQSSSNHFEFGIHIESSDYGASIGLFDSVTYETADIKGSDISATPSGVQSVNWLAISDS